MPRIVMTPTGDSFERHALPPSPRNEGRHGISHRYEVGNYPPLTIRGVEFLPAEKAVRARHNGLTPATNLWTALQIPSDPPVFNREGSLRAIALCKILEGWDALPSAVFVLHSIRAEPNATAWPRSAPSR
jgi:hypothetical protein